ncbi:MAG: insulinase family protein [Clostridioides sp.]|jgi:predicted Zn-dependent peptidase|nr:insulinase family protein [Clostridioides sp.]
MKKIVNDIIREELYYEKLENGLDVYYMPKKGFTKKYAVLATNYGSNELEFIPIGEDKKFRVNEGIAHFLEHKMFEQPDGGNAFDKFSKLGSNANASTNFTMTSYLFTATENFYESLDHLIKYVQTPYFTDENVEKEKGIIAQEIKMYDDDPNWKVYFNCLKGMYVNHPVRIDIAGTVESIYKITSEELYKCYNTFYNPGNMALFVIGDLDPDKIMEVVENANNFDVEKLNSEIVRFYPEEPTHINEKEIVEKFPISMPSFCMGFKDDKVGIEGRELLKKEVVTDILLDQIFNKGSELYEELYNSGDINDSFGSAFSSQIDYGYTIVVGESNDPKKVQNAVFEYIDKVKEQGLSEEDFNRIKKKKLGQVIKSFDSIITIANNFISNKFKGINMLDYLDVIKEVKFEDVSDRLKNHLKEEFSVMSIVEPK